MAAADPVSTTQEVTCILFLSIQPVTSSNLYVWYMNGDFNTPHACQTYGIL